MPRLLPGGPGLAVNTDHAYLAVASAGKLTLIDNDTREEVASVQLLAEGETDLYVSAQRVFAFIRMESSTGCVIYSIPTLEVITSMELIGHAVPLGGVQDRVLGAGP